MPSLMVPDQYNAGMHIGVATALAILSMMVLGCRGTAKVSAHSSRLRSEIVELQDRLAHLERRNRELELALERDAAASQSMPEDVRAAMPHVTDMAIERLSFARDTDGDGEADVLTLYLAPQDGRGRFTQLVGDLAASAMLLPVEGGEPKVVGRISLSPAEVRDAYRSGITGTHYTIEVPLEFAPGELASTGEREIFARVQFRDGLTGQTFTAERMIALP